MKLKLSQQIFEKRANIKFNKNPSSGSRIVVRGRAGGQTDGEQTDKMKLVVAFYAKKSNKNYKGDLYWIIKSSQSLYLK